ncbi:MAG: FtsW/RodA/SpoVE family cell cycle protein [Lachnospiraceae bacterium]|nr:FtsW/RodA/SpoVE family cell cycle protein [Lachnospiraceae bacterium]
MVNFLTLVSRFTILIWLSLFAYEGFRSISDKNSPERRRGRLQRQVFYTFLIFLNAMTVIFFNSSGEAGDDGALPQNINILLLTGIGVAVIILFFLVFNKLISGLSVVFTNFCVMLLATGFFMQTRFDSSRAFRQMLFALVSIPIAVIFIFIMPRLNANRYLAIIAAILGIGLLLVVLVAGKTVYGAKLNITIGPITLQPSEFVKILFVYFIAVLLYLDSSLKGIIIVSALAGAHMLILVMSKDLGNAAIFFIIYLIMLYAATGRYEWLLIGAAVAVVFLFVAYFALPHVRTRFIAWSDPISYANNEGYQISQALFAIGTGGWFGAGLTMGMPGKIPLAHSDFIFASIAEEMGVLFCIVLILIYAGIFILTLKPSFGRDSKFLRLFSIGLAVSFSSQTFITIGGVIKLIPSTGVTLPLVSYGGSSLISSMIIFGCIQGIYRLSASKET